MRVLAYLDTKNALVCQFPLSSAEAELLQNLVDFAPDTLYEIAQKWQRNVRIKRMGHYIKRSDCLELACRRWQEIPIIKHYKTQEIQEDFKIVSDYQYYPHRHRCTDDKPYYEAGVKYKLRTDSVDRLGFITTRDKGVSFPRAYTIEVNSRCLSKLAAVANDENFEGFLTELPEVPEPLETRLELPPKSHGTFENRPVLTLRY